MFPNYYHVLGVERGASQAEIEKAYHRLARKYHPDLNPTDSSAKERFQEIQQAADALRNPESRRAYDQYFDFVDSLRREIREEEVRRVKEELERATKSSNESLDHELTKAKAWEFAKIAPAEAEMKTARAWEAARRKAAELEKEQARAWEEAKRRVLPQQSALTERLNKLAVYAIVILPILCAVPFIVVWSMDQHRRFEEEDVTRQNALEENLRSRVEIEAREVELAQIAAERSRIKAEHLEVTLNLEKMEDERTRRQVEKLRIKLDLAKELNNLHAMREAYFASHAANLRLEMELARESGRQETQRELLILRLVNRLTELYFATRDEIILSSQPYAEKHSRLFEIEKRYTSSRERIFHSSDDKLRDYEAKQLGPHFPGES